MPSTAAVVMVLSSATIRVLSYIFFRWIPGHQLPPIIYTALLIYISSFLLTPTLPAEKIIWLNTDKQTGKRKGQQNRHAFDNRPQVSVDTRRENVIEHLTALGCEVNRSGEGFLESPSKNEETELVSVANDLAEIGPVENGLRTVLLGLPTWRILWSINSGLLWNSATLIINIILVLGVTDAVYRGPMLHPSHDLSFARVGFVSENHAKILIREPNATQVPLYLSYRGVSDSVTDEWKSAGSIYLLSDDTDYTSTVTISRLRPSTRYEYAVSNNHSGFFVTAPPIGHTHPGTSKFTFLTSSCIKPRFPYSPLAHPLSIPGLRQLSKWLPSLQASFMLFLGDFIYIDVPHRFGYDVETYRREYRQVYASPDWPAVSASLPWLHVIDDHEIANDWDRQTADPYTAATDPWNIYHTSLNPPAAAPNASYFVFRQGPASFFMMDTRRHRTLEHAASPHSATKTMLGPEQLSSLLTFLKRDEPTGVKWKFVISSIPFTRNWRLNSADTWAGYLYERRIILEAMWDVGMRGDGVGVVVLSGDRHEFAATAFPPPKNSKWPISATVHEFSTSPLSMFYLPIRSYWEMPGEGEVEEVCIKYAPDGNSKFGAVELEEVKGGEQGLLRFRLFVDGAETWSYVLMTPPAVTGGGRGKDAIWG